MTAREHMIPSLRSANGTVEAKTEAVLLPEPEAVSWLADFGIAYPDHGVATSPQEAAALAESLGYPVVLKVLSPDVVHKSDIGGVQVDLADAGEVKGAFNEIATSLKYHLPQGEFGGVLVCRQAEPGIEFIVGAFHDEVFGPSVAVGMGGVWSEILKDVAFRVAPIDRWTARGMLRDLAAYPVLKGARGQAAGNIEALEDLIVAVSRLIARHSEVLEIDINPVRLYETGAVALDARIFIRSNCVNIPGGRFP